MYCQQVPCAKHLWTIQLSYVCSLHTMTYTRSMTYAHEWSTRMDHSPNKGGTTEVGFLLVLNRITFVDQDFSSWPRYLGT